MAKELSKAETEKIISVIKEVQSKIVNKGNTLVKNPHTIILAQNGLTMKRLLEVVL